ncbi:hypothetical protein [Streptomyces sp. NPDC101132]|uniref:hypothetical protein n=1 Tax=Streptomyces sp. NPDC101132 TaxID=3366110 RepID=UPI0037FB4B3D
MKHTRLTARGAAAAIAAGLALTALGSTTAAAAPKPTRISSAEELHRSLREAIALELPRTGGTLNTDPIGKEVNA